MEMAERHGMTERMKLQGAYHCKILPLTNPVPVVPPRTVAWPATGGKRTLANGRYKEGESVFHFIYTEDQTH